MPTVKFTSGKQFEVRSGESILDEASIAGLILPYSCKTGRCSTCKCRIISGETCIIRPETGLTDLEKENGWVLSCARTAVTDILVEGEDLSKFTLPKAKLFPCRVSHLVRLTADVIQVGLRLPPAANFEFLPGQYIDVTGPNGVQRSYSLASSPLEKELELLIKRVEGGILSRYFFEEAKINDLLRIKGPLGTFFLRETSEADLIFMATGTGIAPIKAMLTAIRSKIVAEKPRSIRLLWGNRTPDDFFFDIKPVETEYSFIPVLSRAQDNWLGARGYVQSHLIELLNISLNPRIYACGSSNMISDTKNLILDIEQKKVPFYSDAFVCSA